MASNQTNDMTDHMLYAHPSYHYHSTTPMSHQHHHHQQQQQQQQHAQLYSPHQQSTSLPVYTAQSLAVVNTDQHGTAVVGQQQQPEPTASRHRTTKFEQHQQELHETQQRLQVAVKEWHQDRDKLQKQISKNKKLNDMYNQLCEKYHRATSDKDEALHVKDEAMHEFSQTMDERDDVLRKLEVAETSLDTVTRQCMRYEAQNRDAQHTLTTLRSEVQLALKERDQFRLQCAEKDQALEKLKFNVLTGQSMQELENLRSSVHRWQAERVALMSECRELHDEALKMKEGRNLAFQLRETAVKERDSMAALCDEMRRDRDEKIGKLAEAMRELDDSKRKQQEAVKRAANAQQTIEVLQRESCKMQYKHQLLQSQQSQLGGGGDGDRHEDGVGGIAGDSSCDSAMNSSNDGNGCSSSTNTNNACSDRATHSDSNDGILTSVPTVQQTLELEFDLSAAVTGRKLNFDDLGIILSFNNGKSSSIQYANVIHVLSVAAYSPFASQLRPGDRLLRANNNKLEIVLVKNVPDSIKTCCNDSVRDKAKLTLLVSRRVAARETPPSQPVVRMLDVVQYISSPVEITVGVVVVRCDADDASHATDANSNRQQLLVGDRILSIENESIDTDTELTPNQVAENIHNQILSYAGRSVHFRVARVMPSGDAGQHQQRRYILSNLVERKEKSVQTDNDEAENVGEMSPVTNSNVAGPATPTNHDDSDYDDNDSQVAVRSKNGNGRTSQRFDSVRQRNNNTASPSAEGSAYLPDVVTQPDNSPYAVSNISSNNDGNAAVTCSHHVKHRSTTSEQSNSTSASTRTTTRAVVVVDNDHTSRPQISARLNNSNRKSKLIERVFGTAAVAATSPPTVANEERGRDRLRQSNNNSDFYYGSAIAQQNNNMQTIPPSHADALACSANDRQRRHTVFYGDLPPPPQQQQFEYSDTDMLPGQYDALTALDIAIVHASTATATTLTAADSIPPSEPAVMPSRFVQGTNNNHNNNKHDYHFFTTRRGQARKLAAAVNFSSGGGGGGGTIASNTSSMLTDRNENSSDAVLKSCATRPSKTLLSKAKKFLRKVSDKVPSSIITTNNSSSISSSSKQRTPLFSRGVRGTAALHNNIIQHNKLRRGSHKSSSCGSSTFDDDYLYTHAMPGAIDSARGSDQQQTIHDAGTWPRLRHNLQINNDLEQQTETGDDAAAWHSQHLPSLSVAAAAASGNRAPVPSAWRQATNGGGGDSFYNDAVVRVMPTSSSRNNKRMPFAETNNSNTLPSPFLMPRMHTNSTATSVESSATTATQAAAAAAAEYRSRTLPRAPFAAAGQPQPQSNHYYHPSYHSPSSPFSNSGGAGAAAGMMMLPMSPRRSGATGAGATPVSWLPPSNHNNPHSTNNAYMDPMQQQQQQFLMQFLHRDNISYAGGGGSGGGGDLLTDFTGATSSSSNNHNNSANNMRNGSTQWQLQQLSGTGFSDGSSSNATSSTALRDYHLAAAMPYSDRQHQHHHHHHQQQLQLPYDSFDAAAMWQQQQQQQSAAAAAEQQQRFWSSTAFVNGPIFSQSTITHPLLLPSQQNPTSFVDQQQQHQQQVLYDILPAHVVQANQQYAAAAAGINCHTNHTVNDAMHAVNNNNRRQTAPRPPRTPLMPPPVSFPDPTAAAAAAGGGSVIERIQQQVRKQSSVPAGVRTRQIHRPQSVKKKLQQQQLKTSTASSPLTAADGGDDVVPLGIEVDKITFANGEAAFIIASVVKDSASERAGLFVGDELLDLNGVNLRGNKPGRNFVWDILRQLRATDEEIITVIVQYRGADVLCAAAGELKLCCDNSSSSNNSNNSSINSRTYNSDDDYGDAAEETISKAKRSSTVKNTYHHHRPSLMALLSGTVATSATTTTTTSSPVKPLRRRISLTTLGQQPTNNDNNGSKRTASKLSAPPAPAALATVPDLLPLPPCPPKSDKQVRTLLVQKAQNENIGITLVGGNLIGIFVHTIASDSPVRTNCRLVSTTKNTADNDADKRSESSDSDSEDAENSALLVRPGDQILHYNGVSLLQATGEQTSLEVSKPACRVEMLVQCNPQRYALALERSGDGFYVRALFDYQGTTDEELSFRRGHVLYVNCTVWKGSIGRWRAWLLDERGDKKDYGLIPNRYRAEEAVLAQRHSRKQDSMDSNDSMTKRWSFFIRRKRNAAAAAAEAAAAANNFVAPGAAAESIDNNDKKTSAGDDGLYAGGYGGHYHNKHSISNFTSKFGGGAGVGPPAPLTREIMSITFADVTLGSSNEDIPAATAGTAAAAAAAEDASATVHGAGGDCDTADGIVTDVTHAAAAGAASSTGSGCAGTSAALSLLTSSVIFPTYQRVERVDYAETRPIVLLGPLSEAIAERLPVEYPIFAHCPFEVLEDGDAGYGSGDAVIQKLYRNSTTTTSSGNKANNSVAVEAIMASVVRDICAKNLHCLLVPSSTQQDPADVIQRLQKVHFFPIVIMVQFKSSKMLKEALAQVASTGGTLSTLPGSCCAPAATPAGGSSVARAAHFLGTSSDVTTARHSVAANMASAASASASPFGGNRLSTLFNNNNANANDDAVGTIKSNHMNNNNGATLKESTSRELHERSVQMETDLKQYITCVVRTTNFKYAVLQIKEVVDKEQRKALWVPFDTTSTTATNSLTVRNSDNGQQQHLSKSGAGQDKNVAVRI